ncbi:hypothetical protein BAR24_14900 [Gluconobacter oxydans]|uniref:effector-associated constant component EACC1 n=1 Tax=Gluconobacter thailandicus TaxID=257438 RepID=UPI000299900E|nr:hypothetical protein [Gluconobacter thailandicus]AFW01771.1 hypothetical protein B932_2209 [Gluconobacter oxydans H24]ANQ42627.1 hypothetical protein BAR24_14900 [Gluconobacter oxydans]
MAEYIEIQFPDVEAAAAGQLADDLADRLRELDETGRVTIQKASPDAMELGSIVVMLLGTASVASVARGIGGWIQKRGDPALKIKCGKDEIVIQSGLSASQKYELAKLALEKSK